MNVIKHTKYIHQYDEIASIELCNQIIKLIEESDSYKNENINSQRNPTRNNSSLGITSRVNIDFNIAEADKIVHSLFSFCHKTYVNSNKALHFALQYNFYNHLSCSYVYRRYDKNDDYDWHIDRSPEKEFVLSYLLYLNDNFEGGDTLFLDDRIRVKPKTGSMLCFPCNIQMTHKSTKIKKGTKRVIWTCMRR
jgi:hypothetical protein